MTDYRALCHELCDALRNPLPPADQAALLGKASALLDQSNEQPSDSEIDALRRANGRALAFVTKHEFRKIARATLARWSA
jgi:hypothetical protein